MKASSRIILAAFLLGLAIACAGISTAGIAQFRSSDTFRRLIKVSGAEFENLKINSSRPTSTLISLELEKAGIRRGSSTDEVLALKSLEWVMNQAREGKDTAYVSTGEEALRLARSGASLSCGPLALLYAESLNALGIQNRIIQLVRSVFNTMDTHVTVEVKIGRNWVVMDPTFHTVFRDESGNWLSAAKIRARLLHNPPAQVEAFFLGDVSYPMRIGSYYLNWRTLFNLVVWNDDTPVSAFFKLPVIRYFYGPKIYLIEESPSNLWQAAYWNQSSEMIRVYLPLTSLFLFLMASILLCLPHRLPSQERGQ